MGSNQEENCGFIKVSTENFNGNDVKSTSSSVKILNIPWKFTVSEENKKLKFELLCNDKSANTIWNCHWDVEITMNSSNWKAEKFEKNRNYQKVFDFTNKSFGGVLFEEKEYQNGKFEIQVRLKMMRVYGHRKRKIINYSIEHPRFSNGILVIENREIHVNKQILAMHSKFFYALFFGEFNDKEKKITEIRDVSYDEFLIFLDFIHPTGRKIEEEFVEDLLKLADLFLADRILDYCEEFLIKTETMDMAKKLVWSERYSLSASMNHCLKSFKTMDMFIQLKKSEYYQEISDDVKSSLLERAFQLHKLRNFQSL
uniref:BTB domain-containing protein n=1 Tax=Caenorhabditis tropicalis TaxID=1561998 RepID=A0A1I7TDB1_9PELO